MGNQQNVVPFQEAARLDLSEQFVFFSTCIFFEVPHSGYPQYPCLQPWTLHHCQPGEGAMACQRSQFSWISFTVIFINLKAQGAEGDWRKLVFPLVSL